MSVSVSETVKTIKLAITNTDVTDTDTDREIDTDTDTNATMDTANVNVMDKLKAQVGQKKSILSEKNGVIKNIYANIYGDLYGDGDAVDKSTTTGIVKEEDSEVVREAVNEVVNEVVPLADDSQRVQPSIILSSAQSKTVHIVGKI